MSVTRIGLDELETVNRYLSGRLTDAECAAFETRLLREPELIREVEAIARFKVGLQALQDRGQLEQAMEAPPWPRLFAVAAAVVVLALGALMYRNVLTPPEPSLLAAAPATLMDRQGNILPSAGTFTVLRKRVATASDAEIPQPAAGHAIELRVLPESPPRDGAYSVSLWQQPSDAPARRLGLPTRVSAASDGFLSVFVDATQLMPGDYLLAVSPTDVDAPTGDVFRIRLDPSRN